MNAFDPGEGWREVRPAEAVVGLEYVVYSDGQRDRHWVRVAPVPPLPTEPYTVIRVEWKDRQPAKEYALIGGRWGVMRPDELAEQMAGFEVLAEPRVASLERMVERDLAARKATAKAVIEEVTEFLDLAWQPGHMRVLSYDLQAALFAHIRDRFGVSS